MVKQLKLTVQGIPPSVNHYMGYRGVRKGNGCMVMAYTKPEANKFKKKFSTYAKEQVKLQEWDIESTRDIHHYVDCIFYFDRTDKDEQNYMKVLCDTLNGIAYIDDKKVLTRTHEVFYDSANPRIEITIHPVTYRGIFPNELHMQQFEENCMTCKRYKRNCSILNKAKEGRVQGEIDGEFVCGKYSKIK
ncbi:RusA family crossover junction endodeoxyribonuclease [Bacillus infantis]|uniref:RusA family crossover junction endodeoxyribonuclease n=1 Tax=Bacillus infantis TaxID=324767 RepID=UPI0020A22AE0|nr:RusA family crossover junction endodeoxyribonuclease [Bacillus infantis]MCP1159260.1 RusA family crossover junction endodeoxyribonuclease [Bacillus infantis]